MYCKSCGKTIEDSAKFCVHCGAAQTEKEEKSLVQKLGKMNNLALIGFAISIFSLFIDWYFLISGLGLALSIAGYMQIEKNKESGKRFAFNGIVYGGISFLISIVYLLTMETTYYVFYTIV